MYIGHQFANYIHDERGSTAIEYGLIAALLSLVIITGLKGVRSSLQNWMTVVSNELLAAVAN